MTYTQPLLTLFFIVSFAGLVRAWRKTPGEKPWLIAVGLAGLFLACWAPADWLFARPLEAWYERGMVRNTEVDAIVVLSASVEPQRKHFPVELPGPDTYARARYAAWFYANKRAVPVYVSGGLLPRHTTSYASTMARIIAAEGVPTDRIRIEDRSKNTHENALFTAELLRRDGLKRIALVTEADSMLRAELCFRKENIDVVPAPVRYRNLRLRLDDLLPSWSALRRNETTLHELVGLAWYKLRGWI